MEIIKQTIVLAMLLAVAALAVAYDQSYEC